MEQSTSSKIYLGIVLVFNFLIPAMILNTVGIIILQLVNTQHVAMSSAAWLESFKDISIFLGSFILGSLIPRWGYKKALLIGALLEIIACILMAIHADIITARIFFVLSGVAFALIKVSVYATVGNFIHDESKHASFINLLEGVFMLGILSGFWTYSFFLGDGKTWTHVYYFLAGLCVLGFILSLFAKIKRIDRADLQDKTSLAKDFKDMLKLLIYNIVWFFVIIIFAYVFIEQSLMTWLPAFYNHELFISATVSTQLVSIFALSIAIGRIAGAGIMTKVKWHYVLVFCSLAAIILLFLAASSSESLHLSISEEITSWRQLPLTIWLFPLVGLFIGPIYPTLCSSILSKLPEYKQAPMTTWIILFSALGGTIGSRITGGVFEFIGGINAIMTPLIPLVFILLLIIPFYRQLKKFKAK